MKTISVRDAAQAAGGKLVRTCDKDTFSGVVHDSRQCGPDDMFVCVKGASMDGHSFLPQVIGAGCRTALISDVSFLTDDMDINVILVEDTVRAMGRLAAWYLDQLDLIRIAVTGSVGKTSTRDMICSVLNAAMPCGKNLKNFNNDIGLPLSIFQLEEHHKAAVLEIGMNHFGEIDYLAGIIRPQIGVITNIGVAHMENLGSRDGIFHAKMELAKHVRPASEGGLMVFVRDEEFLTRERTQGDYERIFIGTNGRSDYIISDIEDRGIDGIRFAMEHREIRRTVTVPVPGRHNAFNAGVAIAIGEHLGMTEDLISKGLDSVELTGSRLKVLRAGAYTVIDDTYNANPDSMKSGLKVLEKSECKGRRVAILGEMYELGEKEKKLHHDVGVFARGCGIDVLIGIGPLAGQIVEGAAGGAVRTAYYETKEAFLKDRRRYIGSGDVILVKASRGMQMEKIVAALTDRKGAGRTGADGK